MLSVLFCGCFSIRCHTNKFLVMSSCTQEGYKCITLAVAVQEGLLNRQSFISSNNPLGFSKDKRLFSRATAHNKTRLSVSKRPSARTPVHTTTTARTSESALSAGQDQTGPAGTDTRRPSTTPPMIPTCMARPQYTTDAPVKRVTRCKQFKIYWFLERSKTM